MRLVTKTDGIMRFLAGQETDKICAVLAHAEDGKLAFYSCCCLIGSFTADHALLQDRTDEKWTGRESHYKTSTLLPYASEAEAAFYYLGDPASFALKVGPNIHEMSDAIRRRRVIPLLRYELRRRELQAGDVGEAGQPTSRKAVLAK